VHQTLTQATETDCDKADQGSIAIVLNAHAGALLGREDAAAEVQRAFESAGASVRMIPPEAGTLPERIALALASGAARLVVAGGDGTIACAAQALAGADGPALGIMPSGTMNLLANDLRIPVGDAPAAIRALMDGTVRAIDVGELSGAEGDGHVFACASMLGTPVRLGRHREAGRHAGNGWRAWLNFARASLRAWRRNRSQRLTLICDGRRMKIRSPSVTVTVNPLDDASGRRFGRSCLDGGALCLYIVRPNTPWRLLRVLVHALTTGTLTDRGIDTLHVQDLVIESRQAALHVLVDGEMRLLPPPLHYRVRPCALHVIVPS
jgi:diacylglycerol kinase family enzyme